MRVLVIITRMHARQDASDDEFGTFWSKANQEAPTPRDPIAVDVSDERHLVVMDGCQYFDDGAALTHAAAEVERLVTRIPNAPNAQLVVLFHSRTLDFGTPELQMREELERLLSARHIAGLYRYAGSELGYPPLALLQGVVQFSTKGQAARETFDNAWAAYANAQLNLALEVMEEAYSRDRARMILRRHESGEIALPVDVVGALNYIVGDDCDTDAALLTGLLDLKSALGTVFDHTSPS